GNNLYDVVRRCKFTVVPSECYETFGLNVVEGFSCGKPTIASKIGAIPELIKDKVNGFLFEYGSEESLVKVVNCAENISDVNYREMCMNARALAENTFNKEIYYKKLINVYDEVILNKKR
ncbi:MAG: glycosyltransferase, partial [Candidatus Brocadiaceae bacterium]